jgi:hypothetical protein
MGRRTVDEAPPPLIVKVSLQRAAPHDSDTEFCHSTVSHVYTTSALGHCSLHHECFAALPAGGLAAAGEKLPIGAGHPVSPLDSGVAVLCNDCLGFDTSL